MYSITGMPLAVDRVRRSGTALAAMSPSWFRVKYRSKAEALRKVFGHEWDVAYIPHPATGAPGGIGHADTVGPVVHGFLLTMPDDPAAGIIETVFPNDPVRWFNPYESPSGEPEHPLCPVTDDFVPGRVLMTHGLATDGGSRLRRTALGAAQSAASCGSGLREVILQLCQVATATEAFYATPNALAPNGTSKDVEQVAVLHVRAFGLFERLLSQRVAEGSMSQAEADAERTILALDPRTQALHALL